MKLNIVQKSENPVCVYDFTCFADDDEKPIIALCEKWAKKWCFQLEETKEGKLHWQGRFSLKVKERLNGVVKKFPKCHLSVTSTANKGNMFYVMKEDSRVKGPFADTDEKIYVPRDIREIDELYPWQEKMIEMSKEYNARWVDVIYCPSGNKGKSTLCRWMQVYKLGRKLPFCNDFKDIMRMVMDMPTAPCYLIDMPRAVNKERLFQLYAGIEEVKSGYAYDDRYHFKEKIFDPPRVFVFTNTLPDENLLSKDRWKLWTINCEKELIKYTPIPDSEYRDIAGF